MTYVATVNVPGYLPMDDDPPTFDVVRDAWDYLVQERRDAEDEAVDSETGVPYSETVDALDARAQAGVVGTVYGDTPGYDGSHDLGLAYCVSEV